MRLEDLNEVRDFKVNDLEHFKAIVIEALENNCHFKKFGQWLHEEYRDYSDKSNQYKAKVIVMNECYNNGTKQFHVNGNDISSVTIYDIFYTNTCGGGFVLRSIDLYYDEIKSFEFLLK